MTAPAAVARHSRAGGAHLRTLAVERQRHQSTVAAGLVTVVDGRWERVAGTLSLCEGRWSVTTVYCERKATTFSVTEARVYEMPEPSVWYSVYDLVHKRAHCVAKRRWLISCLPAAAAFNGILFRCCRLGAWLLQFLVQCWSVTTLHLWKTATWLEWPVS